MKIAVVYNRDSKKVINLFGMPNREKIGMKSIRRITDALKAGKHQTISLEADKDLITSLEEFMPKVVKGERPGMVFNVSYGIQGQARYTHVPSILEMVGVPYIGSGPLAHSIALDKVVTKMVLAQNKLPTPRFAVLESPGFEFPELNYPMIVKPKNEAVSFGIRVVNSETELREAAGWIFDRFKEAVLVEEYIEGREINVGLLGNNPTEPLPPVELNFGGTGDNVYTYEDKTGSSGREIGLICPAPIGVELTAKAQDLARRAFSAVGCYDCARVDMRLGVDGTLYILEINSLPSFGWRGSFVRAAEAAGFDFTAIVNRLIEVASARYFGTPAPPDVSRKTKDPAGAVLQFLTERRDMIERSLREWSRRPSRTGDSIGLNRAAKEMARVLKEIAMSPVPEYTDERSVFTWQTKAGMKDGTLLVWHLDVPLSQEIPREAFRRDPEWLYGEGIGSSRGPLVVAEYALRALRNQRALRSRRLGVLYYLDEGRDCRYSEDLIRKAVAQAKRVLVLRPGSVHGHAYQQRRGQRRYNLMAEGQSLRPGAAGRQKDVLRWIAEKLGPISSLNSRKDRISASVTQLKTESFPMLLPHRVTGTLLVTYAEVKKADEIEGAIREIFGKGPVRWRLDMISDRPPMRERAANKRLLRDLVGLASRWDIPLKADSSVWPSAAGLAPARTGVICGLGPQAQNLQTPREAVSRIGLLQRTLLLALYLLENR
jgi:D-alanine-D-alanine ligase